MSPVIFIMVPIILLIAGGMAFALRTSNRSVQQNRAMAVIKGQAVIETSRDNVRADMDKRRGALARKLKAQGDDKPKGEKKVSRAMLLEQAGLKISPKQFWLFSGVSAAMFVGLAKLFGFGGFLTLMFLIIGLFGFPKLVLKKLIARRQKKFLNEFADALEAMARLLKAGMPVSEAVAMSSREFEGPVGEEMARIYEAQKIGVSLADAALLAARRMPLTEMQMLATGLSIQQQTGSSLSEVLINLGKVIRARYRLRRKVQALSSEAKASAMIIGALPILVGSGLCLINPDYMHPLFHSTVGHFMLMGCACWMGFGIFIMKIMINFKI